MFLVSDRAKASLAANITPTDTQIQLAVGTGAKFPLPQGNPPDNGASGYFPLTLVSAGSGAYEICHCTRRDGDLLTVARGCEGTPARGFITGDTASLNDTAARIRGASQYGHLGNFNPVAITDKSITGYAVGALLVDSSGLFFWQNLKDQNIAAPGTDDSWFKVDFQAIFKAVQGGGYPIGASLIWNGVDNPAQGVWLEEDGSQYDTTQYPLLYAVLKSDRLPNASGRFLRCSNNRGGAVNPDNTPLNGLQNSGINSNQENGTLVTGINRDTSIWDNTSGCFSIGEKVTFSHYKTHSNYIDFYKTYFRLTDGSTETRPVSITKRFLIRAA